MTRCPEIIPVRALCCKAIKAIRMPSARAATSAHRKTCRSWRFDFQRKSAQNHVPKRSGRAVIAQGPETAVA